MTHHPIELPPLPYALDALEPWISKETLSYHHGKHHQAYVNQLNALLPQSDLAGHALEEIVRQAKGPLFNNAAQTWNHSFYWHCMWPEREGHPPRPTGPLLGALTQTFGSFETFQAQFTQTALTTFGSGWAWLVKTLDGKLELQSTSNAGTPLTTRAAPLLTCDVWEHAYYIDYQNRRADYLDAFWKIVHWSFVETQFNG